MNLNSRNFNFRILTIILGSILALLIGEIFSIGWINLVLPQLNKQAYMDLKLIDKNEFKWKNHHYLNYIPMSSSDNSEAPFHNSLGFRGKEFLKKKKQDVFRIVLIGGSAIYSSRVSDDQDTISSQLESVLRAKGYKQVEVINAGIPGHSTAEALINLQFRILEIEPDLVLLYEAINDLHNRYVPTDLHFADNRGRLKIWRGEYFPFWLKSHLGRLVSFYLGNLNKYLFLDYYISAPTYLGHTDSANYGQAFYEKLLRENTTIHFINNLISIYGILKIRKIPLVISTYGFTLKYPEDNYLKKKEYLNGLNEMNFAIRETCSVYNIPLIELQENLPTDTEYWKDEVHVSKKGARRTANIFSGQLVKLKLLPSKMKESRGFSSRDQHRQFQ